MISMRFEIKRIGDICLSTCSGGTPKSTESLYYDGGDIPWLTTGEVDFRDIYDTENKITRLGLEKSSAKFIPINSVIIAMYGVTAGKSAINKIKLTTNQACCNLQIDKKQAYYRYVYYYLMMQSDQLNKLANGGAQQNLNSTIIKKYKISLPQLDEQKKIALLLNNYDQLIENNNKRIKLLESMAELLYKEWFVRFRFPGYENFETKIQSARGWTFGNREEGQTIPNEWNFKELIEIAEFKRGKNITSSEMVDGDIPVISAGLDPSGFHNKANVRGYNLTVSASGANAGYMSYHLQDIWAADCSYYQNDENIWFVYNALKFLQPVISNMQIGSAQPHVYAKNINRLSTIIPNKELIKEFTNKVNPIYDEIKYLNDKNELLMKQRDLLLPRLMSGKLSVEGKEVI